MNDNKGTCEMADFLIRVSMAGVSEASEKSGVSDPIMVNIDGGHCGSIKAIFIWAINGIAILNLEEKMCHENETNTR